MESSDDVCLRINCSKDTRSQQASSGVVASIVLVSPVLDCLGVSLAEVCANCLRCHL